MSKGRISGVVTYAFVDDGEKVTIHKVVTPTEDVSIVKVNPQVELPFVWESSGFDKNDAIMELSAYFDNIKSSLFLEDILPSDE